MYEYQHPSEAASVIWNKIDQLFHTLEDEKVKEGIALLEANTDALNLGMWDFWMLTDEVRDNWPSREPLDCIKYLWSGGVVCVSADVFPKSLCLIPPVTEEIRLQLFEEREFPVGLSRFTGLMRLRIEGKKLEKLPEDISQLHVLETLIISRFQMDEISSSLLESLTLKEFEVWDSGIKMLTLPVGFGEGLLRLRLGNCKALDADTFFESNRFPRLTELIILGVKLSHVPDQIWGMHNLELLEIVYTQIQKFSPIATASCPIKRLRLAANPALTHLDESISRLSTIEEFVMNTAHSMSPVLLLQAPIRILDLSSSPIDTLPDVFEEGMPIEEIHLQSSKLSTLPLSIGKLKGLKLLNISHTPLVKKSSASDLKFYQEFFQEELPGALVSAVPAFSQEPSGSIGQVHH